jgi:hypothetical protein
VNVLSKVILLDKALGPHAFDQRVLRDSLARVLDER